MNPPDPFSSLDPLIDALAERIVDKWLASTASRMVGQTGSPLGARRHRLAVKRRLARNEGGASIVGRRHLLTHSALQEELGLQPRGPKRSPDDDPEPVTPGPGGPGRPPKDRVSDFQAELLKKLRGSR